MFPFITILGRQYSSYAILGLIGLFFGAFIAGRRAKRFGVSPHDVVFLAVFTGIGLMVGGVSLFAFTQIPNIWQNRAFLLVDSFSFLRTYMCGMVFYGGLFGSIAGLAVCARFLKIPFYRCMELLIPVFPLSHAIMRVGCFAAGCCFGIAFPPPIGIAFENSLGAPNGVTMFPVQLLEAAVNLLIFAVLWVYTKRDRDWRKIACLYGIMYGFARFCLEFLRGDEIRGYVLFLSTSQFISVLVLIVSILTLVRLRNAKPSIHD